MKVSNVAIADISMDPANARKHSERNLESIKASLRRFGQQKPIVIDSSGVVRAGNGTLAAAMSLGWETIAAVRTDLKSTEATAYAIADNRTAELAEWDDDVLAATLEGLRLEDGLLEDVGFTDDELERLLAQVSGPEEIIEDDVPEPPKVPVSKPGDLWMLGEHRLLCGDSTKAESLEQLMRDDLAAAVVTDPPYGVDYVGKTKDALVVENDGAEGLLSLLSASLGLASEYCREGGAWYVAAPPGPQFADFAHVLGSLGIWRQTLVWVKDSMVLGRSDYHYRHESIFYGWKPGASHKAPPDRKQTTVWEFDRPKASREHPTMKPVALYAKMLENSTSVGSIVYEPFGGSGTTLIASEQLGRQCRAIEISPAYCDVIVQRWETLTGEKAVLHGS